MLREELQRMQDRQIDAAHRDVQTATDIRRKQHRRATCGKRVEHGTTQRIRAIGLIEHVGSRSAAAASVAQFDDLKLRNSRKQRAQCGVAFHDRALGAWDVQGDALVRGTKVQRVDVRQQEGACVADRCMAIQCVGERLVAASRRTDHGYAGNKRRPIASTKFGGDIACA